MRSRLLPVLRHFPLYDNVNPPLGCCQIRQQKGDWADDSWIKWSLCVHSYHQCVCVCGHVPLHGMNSCWWSTVDNWAGLTFNWLMSHRHQCLSSAAPLCTTISWSEILTGLINKTIVYYVFALIRRYHHFFCFVYLHELFPNFIDNMGIIHQKMI